jgi:hypothetical protein
MRFHAAFCGICLNAGGDPKPQVAELRDDLLFNLECEKGHKSVVMLNHQKFEILFDLGLMSLLDGYSREAVSSFAASVERLYEFCIRVILDHVGVPRDEVKTTWKLVSNQSERQIGAFYFLYLGMFKRVPPSMHPKRIEFRNNVIHKGYIPSRVEAEEYAGEVYKHILEVLTSIRGGVPGVMHSFIGAELKATYDAIPSGIAKTTLGVPTGINVTLPDEAFGKRTFAEVLEQFQKARWLNA